MQRSSRQLCLGHICEERWPPLWSPCCLWYMLARGLPFAFHSRVMNTSTVRYLSYATAHNSRQISGIFAKSRAIWNRIDVCIKWHTSCHFSYIVWDGWYPELIKSVKFSFTAWQYIAGCSYMAQLWRQDAHDSSCLIDLTSQKAAVCFLHLQARCSNHPPTRQIHNFWFWLWYPIFSECSSKTPPGR